MFGADFINDLSEDALDALGEGEDAFRGIGDVLDDLRPELIEGITAKNMSGFKKGQLRKMDVETVALLSKDAVSGIGEDQAKGITMDFIDAIGDKVENLSGDVFKDLNDNLVEDLDADFAGRLDVDQLTGLGEANNLDLLDDDFIEAIDADQAEGVTAGLMAGIGDKVQSLSDGVIKGLETDTVRALNSVIIGNMTNDQLNTLANSGLAEFVSDDAKAGLSDPVLNTLGFNTTQAVSFAVI